MSNETKVGLFITIGIGMLFLLSTQVTNFSMFDKEGYRLNIVVDNVNGLQKSSKVKSNGIIIGKVENFYLFNGKVKIEALINNDVLIPLDSKVSLKQESMLGLKYLDIILGKKSQKFSKNSKRQILNSSVYTASFDDVSNSVDKTANDISKFIERLDKIIATNENNINVILENFNIMSKELVTAVSSFENMSKEFNKTALTINSDLPRIMNNIDNLVANLNSSSTVLDNELPEILANIKDISKDLKSLSKNANQKLPTIFDKFEKLEDSATTLIDDNQKNIHTAIYNASNFFDKGEASFSKLDDYLASVTQGEMRVDMYNSYMLNDKYNRVIFGIDYRANPTKHYLVDVISTDDFSLNNDGTIHSTKKHEDTEFLFSAQFAKDYENARVRIGAIESTGGLGIDYFMLNKKVKISGDLFDFNAVNDARGDKAHLRLTSRLNINKHINFYLGADNLLNKDSVNMTLGMGISFIDDDLKYLLGSAR